LTACAAGTVFFPLETGVDAATTVLMTGGAETGGFGAWTGGAAGTEALPDSGLTVALLFCTGGATGVFPFKVDVDTATGFCTGTLLMTGGAGTGFFAAWTGTVAGTAALAGSGLVVALMAWGTGAAGLFPFMTGGGGVAAGFCIGIVLMTGRGGTGASILAAFFRGANATAATLSGLDLRSISGAGVNTGSLAALLAARLVAVDLTGAVLTLVPDAAGTGVFSDALTGPETVFVEIFLAGIGRLGFGWFIHPQDRHKSRL
jgi:hypothetical protein